MKTIKIAILVLIVTSMINSGCQKNNLISTTEPVIQIADSSFTESKVSIKKFIKPENFVAGITNQYFPLPPGDTLKYQTLNVENGDSILEDGVYAITSEIKVITDISCEVIHHVVTIAGVLHEDTYDWYAQDIYGNVWYFGEDTKKYDSDGSYSTEGSFENGVDGAVAGIIMPADPSKYIGVTYRQEYYVGHAQDKATTLSTTETVTIGYGTFYNCVKTEEITPLEPDVKENKWYAPGIGEIKALIEIGGDEHEELTGKN